MMRFLAASTVVFFIFLGGMAQAREIGAFGGVSIHVADANWCAPTVSLTARSNDPAAFAGEAKPALRAVGLSLYVVASECPVMTSINLTGETNGKTVYKSQANNGDGFSFKSLDPASSFPNATPQNAAPVAAASAGPNPAAFKGEQKKFYDYCTRNATLAIYHDCSCLAGKYPAAMEAERSARVAAAKAQHKSNIAYAKGDPNRVAYADDRLKREIQAAQLVDNNTVMMVLGGACKAKPRASAEAERQCLGMQSLQHHQVPKGRTYEQYCGCVGEALGKAWMAAPDPMNSNWITYNMKTANLNCSSPGAY